MKTQTIKYLDLTTENAWNAAVIISKANPEWGTKRFNFEDGGKGISSFGVGSNSAVIFESDYKFWSVVSFK